MELEIKKDIKIQELKKLVLISKKDNIDVSKSYASILKQVESATIGVKNPEKDETKLILNAARKELKEQEQSKNAGAPYSSTTIIICDIFIKALAPEVLSPEETEKAVALAIQNSPELNVGKIVNEVKTTYGVEKLNMKLVMDTVKRMLQN